MTEPPAPDDSADALRDALAACIERIAETGRFEAAEAVVSAHPEHAAALRERLAKLHRAGMLPLADGPAEMPRQLGEFVLLEPLGRGGMGVVHLARQASLDRLVAVKLVHPELLYFPGARERFRREVEAVARLQHPGIVPVYSVGEEHGIPYYAMERLVGATVADVIADCRKRSIDSLRGLDMRAVVSNRAGHSAAPDTFTGSWTEAACRLVAEVALALQHAHERGVLHRDLKPSNVMLTIDGRAVLLDFGLAAASGTDSLTKSGAMVGTLAYMAPEQVRGEATDARSDVYSLGATLYEMLALAPAHSAPSSDALREAVLRGSVVALPRHNHAVPRDVDTICRKAMDVDPARRYPTAAALAEDLERFLAHRPIFARPAGPWLRLRRWTKRHPAPAAALGVAALALAVTAALLLQRDSARDASDANLRSALEAVGVLVDRAKSPEFVGTPGLDPIRAQQLDDAVDLLQRLHDKNESNPRTRLALAKGLLDAARLRRDLGRSAGAAEATATARSILQVLLRDHADDAAVLATAASLELLDGSLHRAASDLEAAERRFAEALRLLQPLGDRDDATLLALRAAALVDLANLDRLSKDLDRADTRLHEAIALDDRRLALGRTFEALQDAARTRSSHAAMLVQSGQPEQALPAFYAQAALFDEMGKLVPDNPEVTRERARNRVAVAMTLRSMHRFDEALPEVQAALATMNALHQRFPQRTQYEWDRNMFELELAQTAEAAEHLDDAAKAYEAAIAHHRTLIQKQPAMREARSELAIMAAKLAAVRVRRGDGEPAMALLQEAVELQQVLVAESPDDAHWRSSLGRIANEAAKLALDMGTPDRAIPPLQIMLDLYATDRRNAPDDAQVLAKYAYSLQMLAVAKAENDDPDGAMAMLQSLQDAAPLPRHELLEFASGLHLDDRADFRALLAKAK